MTELIGVEDGQERPLRAAGCVVAQALVESCRPAWRSVLELRAGAVGHRPTLQPDASFGRILAAYGGVFVAGSLAWGMALDGFRPDRYDITGALVCLLGVGVIMYTQRP